MKMRIVMLRCRGFLAAAALAAVFCSAPGAHAEDANWYVGANLPLMFIDDSESNLDRLVQAGFPGNQPPCNGQDRTWHRHQARPTMS